MRLSCSIPFEIKLDETLNLNVKIRTSIWILIVCHWHVCYFMLQGLFRNFQDAFLPLLKDHLRAISTSSLESKQRCATEIIAALVRGSKHWDFHKMDALQSYLVPVMKSALASMTNDTFADWGTCIATSLVRTSFVCSSMNSGPTSETAAARWIWF